MTSSKNNKTLIAIIQTTINSKKDSFKEVENFFKTAHQWGVKMLFLPEFYEHFDSDRSVLKQLKSYDDKMVDRYCALAKKYNVWMSLGGIPVKDSLTMKLNNTHFIVNNLGIITGKYLKTHLDDNYPKRILESTYTNYGNLLSPTIDTPCGRLSMGMSCDMRYPEMSILNRRSGAEILTFPSALCSNSHWSTLLSARAIENQCYVIAATQKQDKQKLNEDSFGNSLVVDPSGTVITEITADTGIATAHIDIQYLQNVRRRMPIMKHRRLDLYYLCTKTRDGKYPWTVEILPPPSEYCQHKFGNVFVPGSCIILKTYSSFVCVNKKPVYPHHLLVISDRPAESLKDLKLNELCDVAQTVYLSTVLLRFTRKPADVQISIQDGVHSGQTIKHLHIHLVPTGPKFTNIDEGDHKITDRPSREQSEMEKEASTLRSIAEVVVMEKMNEFVALSPKPLEIQQSRDNSPCIVKTIHIHPKVILFSTNNFLVFAPCNPVLEGHIIITVRSGTNLLFDDLTAMEVSELFQCLQIIEKILMKVFKTSSVTTNLRIIDDGKLSNMLFHIVPRFADDLKENDEIYQLLLNYDNNIYKHCFTVGGNSPWWIKAFIEDLPQP